MSQTAEVPPQLLEAISLASSPNTPADLRGQALEFLEQVKNSAGETWRYCLGLFLGGDKAGTGPEGRLWALGVVDEVLGPKFDKLAPADVLSIQEALFTYIQNEYVTGGPEGNTSFLRNKLSHTLTRFFIQTYDTTHPSLLADLLTLLRQPSPPALNPRTTLLVLHVLNEISLELSDNILRGARQWSGERQSRDAKMRDAVRGKDADKVVAALVAVMQEGSAKLAASEEGGWTPRLAEEAVELATKVYASWSHWIDISLTLTPQSLALFYSLLASPSLPVRIATTNVFTRMVQKGIQEASAKLELIRILNLSAVLGQLEEQTRAEPRRPGEDAFREACAKTVNALGTELIKLCEESSGTPQTRATAHDFLASYQPLFLRYLSDPNDATSLSVHQLLVTTVSFFKKQKRTSAETFMTPQRREFLSQLLPILMQKMEWNPDAEWGFGGLGEDEDDDWKSFSELRRNLKSSFDAIAQLDEQLWTPAVVALINNTLSDYRANGPAGVPWQKAELTLYVTYLFAEAVGSGNGIPAMVQLTDADKAARAASQAIPYEERPLTPLGQLVVSVIESGISAYPHPSANLQFFELIVRYVDLLKVRKAFVPEVLSAFLDHRGVHNPQTNVRVRIYYLFQRFTQLARSEIPPEFVPKVLESLTDVLVVDAEIPSFENPEEDLLSKAVTTPGVFQNQLYLFEAVGGLLSRLLASPDQLSSILSTLAAPLFAGLQQALQMPVPVQQDIRPILLVHHYILALGHIAKGLPESSEAADAPARPWVEVFQQATQAILTALSSMSQFKVIRDASRFSFAQIVNTTGSAVVEHVPTFIHGLLGQLEAVELSDFLTFVGLLIHKLKSQLASVLDGVIGPIIDRVFFFVGQEVTGTDDAVQKAELEKAYLSFVGTILSSGLEGVFISDQNKGRFETFLTSLIKFASNPAPATQRIAFSVLGKVVTAYGSAPQANGAAAAQTSTPVPGFEQFIYSSLTKLAFEVPSQPTFNIKDGQSSLVLGEISGMLRTIHVARGSEFRDFLSNVYLPSIGAPSNLTLDFVQHIEKDEPKAFRKYFTDFMRASRGNA